MVHKTFVDSRTARHRGYGINQIRRKRIEEVFGWIKTQASSPRSSSADVPRSRRSLPSRLPSTTSSAFPNCWREAPQWPANPCPQARRAAASR